ncbi:MAG: hypoxanthine phosphoribosyltransferase [Verrucomicrobiae bacterium]|nr:hypoxanthine phosphoribosyltransferase [Verrucomicrobiae bacterium]
MPRSRPRSGPGPTPAAPPPPVPSAWRSDIARVLLTETQIANRVAELADEIQRDFASRDTVVVAILNGTVLFLADLLRHLDFPVRLDFVGTSSYGTSTTPGHLSFTRTTRLDVRNRDVLVVDDILDTGKTLDRVVTHLRPFKPRRLRTCVLLDKKARRQVKIRGDYTGFAIPDEFVVGYGLDFAERYRNLPFIGVLKPEILHPDNPSAHAQRPPRPGPRRPA